MEFIKGKWYRTRAGSIVKFLSSDFGIFNSSEFFIYDDLKTMQLGGQFGSINGEFTELDISDVQQYLPDGHPDKIVNKIKEDGNTQLIRILNEIR